ncbi:MAG: hypothetical protein RSH79_04060 [Clostridiales bacterium]
MDLLNKKTCCDEGVTKETPKENFTCNCNCSGKNEEKSSKKPTGKNLKAYIDVRYCGANQDHCQPMKDCPNEAIEIISDEHSGFGHRFVVNEEKCDGCGICIDICCGDCMELK